MSNEDNFTEDSSSTVTDASPDKNIFDDDGNAYSRSEIVSIVNLVKRDTANFIFGEANCHCNKLYRTANDNWHPWTDSLLKGLNNNKEKLRSLLRKNGHSFLRQICFEDGSEAWNNSELIKRNKLVERNDDLTNEDFNNNSSKMINDLKYGIYALRIEECCNKLNQKLSSKDGLFTQWGVLKLRPSIKMAGEKAYSPNPEEGVSIAELKETLLQARRSFYQYKKEKYEIINRYYHQNKF